MVRKTRGHGIVLSPTFLFLNFKKTIIYGNDNARSGTIYISNGKDCC